MASFSVCTQAAFPLRVNDFACWVDLGGNWESQLGLGLITGVSWGYVQAPIRGEAQVFMAGQGEDCGAPAFGEWLRKRLQQGAAGLCSEMLWGTNLQQVQRWGGCGWHGWTSWFVVLVLLRFVCGWFFFVVCFCFVFPLKKEGPFRSERGLRLVVKYFLLVFKPRRWWTVLGWEGAEVLPKRGVWAEGPGCVWSCLRDVGYVPGSVQVAGLRLCHKVWLGGSHSFLDLLFFYFSWPRREGFLLLHSPSVKISFLSHLYFPLHWIKESGCWTIKASIQTVFFGRQGGANIV